MTKLVRNSRNSRTFADSAANALAVYRDALKERKRFQEEVFEGVDEFFDVINSFLNGKQLAYEFNQNRSRPRVGLKFPDETWGDINIMSSGERQLLTMLYAVNKLSQNTTVLIDEPEISLHIDWQEQLLQKMMSKLKNRQIIVCTHSPSIAADFNNFMIKVEPQFITSIKTYETHLDDDEDCM